MDGEEERKKAVEKAAAYAVRGYKTRRQVRDYLTRRGYGEDVIEHCLEKLSEYKYVDDAAYAAEYARVKSPRTGAARIASELRARGIDRETAAAALNGLESGAGAAAAAAVAEKYMTGKTRDAKSRAKLYRYLYGRGFSGEDAENAVAAVFRN